MKSIYKRLQVTAAALVIAGMSFSAAAEVKTVTISQAFQSIFFYLFK